MTRLRLDAQMSDDERRQALYDGDVFTYHATEATTALRDFAASMIGEAFGELEPVEAQHAMPVERYAEILSDLKPRYIHAPENKQLIQRMLTDAGCDPEKTYFDVPRLRSSTSGGYLTTGIAYAFHPHRDTWYSAPQSQLNWWLPIHDLTSDEGMAFHPAYWSRGVENGSRRYNYAEWNRVSRFAASEQIGVDKRDQPKPEAPMELAGDLRVHSNAGSLMIFSAAQMHSSLENHSGRTRFSIDFRTVHLDDLEAGVGAPNVDSECTGTTLGDYIRVADLAHLPDELISRYDDGYGRPDPVWQLD